MKVLKSILLFAVCASVTSCFEPPGYSFTPQINFVSVCFKDATTSQPTDVLNLTISFRDGDGDLGLASDQIEEPYQDIFYGLASGGDVADAGKETVLSNRPQFVKVPPGATGKLVTVRTLQDPAYADNLPPFIDAVSSCIDYKLQTVYVQEKDKSIIDESYADIDTLNENGVPYYIIQDMFYYKRNPNHRNIDVEFWVNHGTGDFELFDWEKEYCEIGFNQRFPIMSEKNGPLEGDLGYAIASVGIRATFGAKTLRLKIRIRDRALNVSNEIWTDEFTLDSIKSGCD